MEVIKQEYTINYKNNEFETIKNNDAFCVQENQIIFNKDSNVKLIVNVEIAGDTNEIVYILEENASVELIETRTSSSEGSVGRTIKVFNDASVAMLVLNDCSHEVTFGDSVEAYNNAEIESAYAELSLCHVNGTYTYNLVGEGANVNVKTAALANEGYVKDFEVSLLHKARNTSGQMSNYGVTKDRSKLTFDGIGKIEQGMSQSSTHQTSKIMVFDNECIARANPYLYIDEYDVKASHAAGVGRMDEEHLFYLQSRGLTKNSAMKLITYGYLMPVVDVIDNETVKEMFIQTLEKRMGD